MYTKQEAIKPGEIMDEGKKKKKRIVMIIVGALLLLALVIIFFIWRSKITATTMRILRLEGEVTLEDNGSPKQVKENLRLKSGNALATALQSLVSIGLDDTKIVTLNEKSRAEFNQSGRKLDLELTAGSLFFEVSEPLTDEETFDIRTSTMVVGIRGTSGLVSVEGGNESLIISDGTVHVVGTNQYTGEVKEIDVSAGQKITVYLYNDREVDSIEFFLEEVTEHDMPEFALQRMRENEELLDKIVAETGWDKPWILMEVIEVPNASSDDGDDGGDDDPGPSGGTKIAEETDLPELPEEDELPETEEGKSSIEEQIERAIHAIVHVDPATGVLTLADGTQFDPAFYAASNPDVVAKYGTDPEALLAHWLAHGKKEGRPPMPPVVAKAEESTNNDPNAGNSGGSSDEEEEEEPEPEPTGTGGNGATADSTSYDSSVSSDVPLPGGATGFIVGSNNMEITSGNTAINLPYTITDTHTGTVTTLSNLEDVHFTGGSTGTVTKKIGTSQTPITKTETGYTYNGNTYDVVDEGCSNPTPGGTPNPLVKIEDTVGTNPTVYLDPATGNVVVP